MSYLPCSPHCKPEVRDGGDLDGNYDFFRCIIRLANQKSSDEMQEESSMKKLNSKKYPHITYESGEEIMLSTDDRKTQRGQRRKLKAMFRYIDKFVPFSDTEQKYEHFHVPSSPFIESNRTNGSVKTAFCRKWLETTEKFISQKPVGKDFCKIVAVLSVPNLWSSQIIIFYDESYYDSFWDRTYPEQFWTLVEDKRSFCKDRNIVTSLAERCYRERIVEDENIFECDLWFYGDLPIL